ncbi:MAG TPA: efflux RND transporter periplasmic adaptor subunit [Chthoniobacteraceae bacterium]|jgi:RND family efflux transporter MFP subunit|nr:family efflux transporter, subunit [Chthoniobacter sp.]HEV7867868.1 efflux RND transporter periplasmic adaptor subunit [Chthoniobacteraceae bacterium]
MVVRRFVYFVLALGLILQAGCRKAATAAVTGPAAVVVAHPVPKKLIEWDQFTGRLGAVASVEVRARVSGYLESTHFKEGTEVKEGDLLFVVDPRRYNAELAGAQAELARAQAGLELATAEAGRAGRLVQTRAISAEESDVKVKSQQQAQATLASAQAALDAAKLEVEFTRVTAPISGRVGRKLVTEGNLITGGPNGATVLTTIVALDPIYCYFDVDERSALKYRQLVKDGKRESALFHPIPAQMGLANEEGFPKEGEIDFVDNELSATTGSIRARGVFGNKDRLMAPGFFARLRIPGSGEYEAMLVRDTAIGSDQGRPFVYVVGEDGKATQRRVVTGPLEDGLRIVREGLKVEDSVVINGLMAIRPGVVVKAEQAEMKPVTTAALPAN